LDVAVWFEESWDGAPPRGRVPHPCVGRLVVRLVSLRWDRRPADVF
jgi:hypothetical protein